MSGKGAGPYGARYIQVTGVRTVRHRRPDGAAPARGLDYDRFFPEGLEDAAGLLEVWERLGAVRHDRVADRVGLGLCRFLARLLGHRAFFDSDQRFAVGAVEDVNPAGLAGFGDPLARLTVDHGVEENDRARRVIVPDVMVHFLKVPDIFPGLGLQSDDRDTEEVVAFAPRAVVVGPAIAGGEINEAELRIESRRVPDRRSTAHRMVGAGRPSVVADLAHARQGIPSPADLGAIWPHPKSPHAAVA